MHTHLHTRTDTRRRHLFDVCVCVCALHNAGVKVSGLIFYLSGLITIAFTAALLRVRGGYSISAESLQGASEEEREKENTKLHVYNLYRESHKTLQLQTLPVLEVFYSLLPQCRKQQQQIPSVISDRADVSLLQSRCLFEKGKTRHKAFKWN